MMRITSRGEDRAPSLPPTAAQTAQGTTSGDQRPGRYVIKYTDTGREVHRFGAPTPQQAIETANNLQRAYSSVMRWGGNIGGLRGIALYSIAPNTDEQELFYMGPGEAIVNQPAAEPTPGWANDPNISVTNNTPRIRNPGGSGDYALFSGDGEQLTDAAAFMNYQNATSYFTINYSSSLGTGWTVRQLA
jgi:hypothetical protein